MGYLTSTTTGSKFPSGDKISNTNPEYWNCVLSFWENNWAYPLVGRIHDKCLSWVSFSICFVILRLVKNVEMRDGVHFARGVFAIQVVFLREVHGRCRLMETIYSANGFDRPSGRALITECPFFWILEQGIPCMLMCYERIQRRLREALGINSQPGNLRCFRQPDICISVRENYFISGIFNF